jgi:hypothetical protein
MGILDTVRDEKNKQKVVDQWVESLEPQHSLRKQIDQEGLRKTKKCDNLEKV